jgi:anaerobic magnesium-protoporphyrin IX monomethyl ester cyclase
MTRILLVGPAYEENLSIRYLSSALTAGGHQAELARFDSAEDAAQVVASARTFDVVGLSMAFQVRAREFLALARALKADRPERPVIAGGHYASCAAHDLLARHPELDGVVLHEGEQTLLEIADRGWHPAALPQIGGLAWRGDEGIARTPVRPLLEDLDSLPTPDRRGPITLFAGVPSAYMLGSRGCVGGCDYCCIMTLHRMAGGRRFRQRRPEAIADEMAALYHGRGIRQFVFHDDNFLVPSVQANHRRLDALEQAWQARGMTDLGLVIKCRPPDAEPSVFERLRDLGMLRVFLGVESSSEAGLASIGRNQFPADSAKALELCAELGVSAQYTMMMFHPEATLETVRSDLGFMGRYDDFALNFCRTEIYAGTPLERRMVAQGRTRGDYLARAYSIADPRADLASRLAARVFYERCWSMGGLMERTIGLDHLGAVVGRFYDDDDADRIRAQIRDWRLAVNRELTSLLTELVDAASEASGVDDPALVARIAELTARERAGREVALAEGAAIRSALDAWFPERVGLRRAPDLQPAPPTAAVRLARHAAAVLLAFSVGSTLACTSCQEPIGVCEYAAPPMDTDSDGLLDGCEISSFATDPGKVDSDGDGVLDGKEDHDGDGVDNATEQEQVGDWACPEPAPAIPKPIEENWGVCEYAAPPLEPHSETPGPGDEPDEKAGL